MPLPALLPLLAKFGPQILSMAGKIAPVLGGAAKGRAEGRSGEISDQLWRDRLNLDATRANNDGTKSAFDMGMRAREFGLTAPRYRMGNVTRGSLMAAGPMKVNWGGPGSGMRGEQTKVTGGFMERDPRMKMMGDAVMDRELQAQLGGEDKVTAPTMDRASMATPAPKPSFGDKALGWGAGAAGILGAIGAFRKKPAPTSGGFVNPSLMGKVQF